MATTINAKLAQSLSVVNALSFILISLFLLMLNFIYQLDFVSAWQIIRIATPIFFAWLIVRILMALAPVVNFLEQKIINYYALRGNTTGNGSSAIINKNNPPGVK